MDLKNPELYTYQEEEEIRIIREKKEEEWKKRIQEVATKEKNDKVIISNCLGAEWQNHRAE